MRLAFCSSLSRLGSPTARVGQDFGGKHVAAGNVDVSRYLEQTPDGLGGGKGLHHHIDGQTPLQNGGLAFCQQAGGFYNLIFGHPGDLGHLVQRVLTCALGQFVEAVAPPIDEVAIV